MTGIRPSLIAASRRRVDPDAADYFARIVAAGSSISAANRAAVDVFVRGCKADGIWSAIKACCLLAGPDDLTGALVPLVGTAPTNVNFVSADYNRTTGLVGDGSTKYLNSNRNNNTDPQNSKHHSVYVSSLATAAGILNGAQVGGAAGQSGIAVTAGVENTFRVNNAGAATYSQVLGFLGANRSNSTQINIRRNNTSVNDNRNSDTPANENIGIFGRTVNANITNARLSFYSIGESLDLALLDARISTYMASLA